MLLVLLVLAAIVLLSVYADEFPEWTGLRTFDPGPNRLTRAKTLWDWLDLLIVGAVLAAGGVLWNRSARKRELQIAEKNRIEDRKLADERREQELRIAEDNRNQATLQAYYDKMAGLLLKNDLGQSEKLAEVRSIARALTLATLKGLDGERRGFLIEFLYESHLLGYSLEMKKGMGDKPKEPILYLGQANMSGANLRDAHLHRVNLTGTNLRGANLGEANLSKAFLSRADLSEADLHKTNLGGAILTDANLSDADLTGAWLSDAGMGNANLGGADLRGTDLSMVTRLDDADVTGAKYDNETEWPDGFDPEAAGAIFQEAE